MTFFYFQWKEPHPIPIPNPAAQPTCVVGFSVISNSQLCMRDLVSLAFVLYVPTLFDRTRLGWPTCDAESGRQSVVFIPLAEGDCTTSLKRRVLSAPQWDYLQIKQRGWKCEVPKLSFFGFLDDRRLWVVDLVELSMLVFWDFWIFFDGRRILVFGGCQFLEPSRSWNIMVHLEKSTSWNPPENTDSHVCTRPPSLGTGGSLENTTFPKIIKSQIINRGCYYLAENKIS